MADLETGLAKPRLLDSTGRNLMPIDNQLDPRDHFTPRYLPWLLGGVMLAVYCATLNHWVTLLNLYEVAAASGFTWQPEISNPLSYPATLPFRWLPAAILPLALNLFSAVCAAGTLAVLARSVAILPHDRTEMERTRERSDFSFLTNSKAWLPPVAAALFAGLQLTFWEHATSFSGEIFQLLWFAIILWQLLEYRMDERESRLYLASFLYGASLTENWAMAGFFPLFLIAIIWLRKLDFFSIRFLSKMAFWGLAGLLFILLLVVPLTAKYSGAYPVGMWTAIKLDLHNAWELRLILWYRSEIRHDLAIVSLTSLLPVFLMSLRWSSTFGDSSRLGTTMVNYMMHFVSLVILGALVWVSLDPPFSPRKIFLASGINVPALTFHYLTVLCIGYYSGYLLLIFGTKPRSNRRGNKPDSALPRDMRWLYPLIVAGTMAMLTAGAGLLIYRNLPMLLATNDDSLLNYARFTAKTLPDEGAILLSDSDNSSQAQPIHTYLVQALLAREGQGRKFAVVETQYLASPAYHNYLHQRFPELWPGTSVTNGFTPLSILILLNNLAKSNRVCYLNPSFGYYFERFYLEPHGLTYKVKKLPDDKLLPPATDPGLIQENDSFWTQVMNRSSSEIQKAESPANLGQQYAVFGWLMRHLRISSEGNPNALVAGTFYSRGLNYLGVQAQRAGELDLAAHLFGDACLMNSNNVAAKVNGDFNHTLRAGLPTGSISLVTPDRFGRYTDWSGVLCANGPFDDTSFCFEHGVWLLQAQLLRQAAVEFDRVRQLAPENLAARLFLAEINIFYRQPTNALEVLHDPLTYPSRFALTEFNSTELNILAASAYFQLHEDDKAARLLDSEMEHHPDNETLMFVSAQAFNMRGLYTNALRVVNRKLTRSPDDPTWLYGKGIICLQIKDFDDSIVALNRFLEIQTNNPAALFDRAVAYYQSDRLEAARADFEQLQATYANSYQVAYGLGEVARRQHETNEAIRNYRLYLAQAPTNNVAEIKTVRDYLRQLDAQ